MKTNKPEMFARSSTDQRRDLVTRTIQVRAATLNEEDRSVEAAMSTEGRVAVFDWSKRQVIEEVLLARGAEMPEQVVLLENHSRWSLDDVLGSVRNMRIDAGKTVGRMYFAAGDDRAERAWQKVKQGHIADVSVGYRVLESVDIPANKRQAVQGRFFEAGDRPLRVTTRWAIKELSLVPVGADPAAKVREEPGPSAPQQKEILGMNKKLREYLVSLGMRADASDEDAQAYCDALSGDQRIRAEGIKNGTIIPAGNQRNEPTPEPTPEPEPEPKRNEPAAEPPVSLENVRAEAAAAERQRAVDIRNLRHNGIPNEIVERAIDEGWDVKRAALAFAQSVRDGRQEAVPSAPAGHSHSHDEQCNVRSLAASLLIGQGLDPLQHSMHNGARMPERRDTLIERDADLGDQFARMSAVDLVRECAHMDSGRYYRDPGEAYRAAMSGGTLGYVFTTNVYAKLITGWQSVGDTTVGWCDEEDVANFLPQESITLSADAKLKRLPPGGTAKDATLSDKHETYRIARFARKFTVDEQNVIDDRLGAIMKVPFEMGEAARNFRPDLVYSLMLENPSLVADSTALFHGDHNNLGTDTLSDAGMKAGILAMGSQRDINNNVLNIPPKYVIVPQALRWTAKGLTSADVLKKLFADSGDPIHVEKNLLADEGIVPVVDDRIGATGVIDPRDGETTHTGSAANWFLAHGGTKSIRVVYRRGTNRLPVLRSYILTQGQWGHGWDINLDIGAAFMDFAGWYKSTGGL